MRLLQEASKENGLVVCHSKSSAEHTKDMAINMYRKGDLKSVPEIVYVGENISEERRGERIKDGKRLFLDNTELVLGKIFKTQVGKFVVCDEDEFKGLKERGYTVTLRGEELYTFSEKADSRGDD